MGIWRRQNSRSRKRIQSNSRIQIRNWRKRITRRSKSIIARKPNRKSRWQHSRTNRTSTKRSNNIRRNMDIQRLRQIKCNNRWKRRTLCRKMGIHTKRWTYTRNRKCIRKIRNRRRKRTRTWKWSTSKRRSWNKIYNRTKNIWRLRIRKNGWKFRPSKWRS